MHKSALTALVAALAAIASPSQAEPESWDFRGFIYLWGAALGGSTVSGQNIELSFSEVVKKLDFGLMGALEANRGRISFLADFQYLNLGEDGTAPIVLGVPAAANADVSGFVFSGTAGYDFFDDRQGQLVGFGGIRFMDLDTTANLAVPVGPQRISGNLSNLDAVIGLRGVQNLSDRWNLSYYADVGTGDSELTWQAALTFDYRINSWDLSFGYRHLAWDIDNSAVLSDLSFSGPFVGAKIPF